MTTEIARKLRREATPAEVRIWSRLRNRALCGCKFRRQMPIDRFVADFACVEARLVIEVDGSQHWADDRYEMQRTAALDRAGYLVLRFPNASVLERIDDVVEEIVTTLDARLATLSES